MDSPESTAPVSGHVTLILSGMTCAGCVRSVERKLSAVPGVTRVEVDLAGGRAMVVGTAVTEALVDAVKGQGYGVRLAD
jgi:copper chaperone CopZ